MYFNTSISAEMIAGHTEEYINSVLEKVAKGDRYGGLRQKRE